jgi:pimeloyl-ACP methyl ester carboxylesterase
MAPVAQELACHWGVLEPIQTAASLDGQIEELRTILNNHGSLPVAAIGFSWGAWLAFIVSSRYPDLIRKLILVSSGPFEEKYATGIQEVRMNRLSEEDRTELKAVIMSLRDPASKDLNTLLDRLGALASKSDAFDPITHASDNCRMVDARGTIFRDVWEAAAELRRSGALLEFGRQIQCPVVAIHGDYDPHPAEGVARPLKDILKDFRFVLLKDCGHKPWLERRARDDFYRILRAELP